MPIKTSITNKTNNIIDTDKLPTIVLHRDMYGNTIVGIAIRKYGCPTGTALSVMVLHSESAEARPGDRLELAPSLHDVTVYDGVVKLSNA